MTPRARSGLGEVRDAVVGAPQLEAEDRLQILALEQDRAAQPARQPRRRIERGLAAHVVDAAAQDQPQHAVDGRWAPGRIGVASADAGLYLPAPSLRPARSPAPHGWSRCSQGPSPRPAIRFPRCYHAVMRELLLVVRFGVLVGVLAAGTTARAGTRAAADLTPPVGFRVVHLEDASRQVRPAVRLRGQTHAVASRLSRASGLVVSRGGWHGTADVRHRLQRPGPGQGHVAPVDR